MKYIVLLPPEIWEIIISLLEDGDVINVSFVDKKIHNIINCNNFWALRETVYMSTLIKTKFNVYDRIKWYTKIYNNIKNNHKKLYHMINDNKYRLSYSDIVKKDVYLLLCSNEIINIKKISKNQTKYEFNEDMMIDKIIKNENYGDDYYYHTSIYYDNCIIIECVLITACGRIGIYIINPYLNTCHTLITNNYCCCRDVDYDHCTSCIIYGNYIWYTIYSIDNYNKTKYEKIIVYDIFTNKKNIIIEQPIVNSMLIFCKENNNLYLALEDVSKYDPIWKFQVNIESGQLETERGIIRHREYVL